MRREAFRYRHRLAGILTQVLPSARASRLATMSVPVYSAVCPDKGKLKHGVKNTPQDALALRQGEGLYVKHRWVRTPLQRARLNFQVQR